MDDSTEKWSCEIREAYLSNDEEFKEIIPKNEWDFWYNECRPYPDPSDPGHCPPRHKLPQECTFNLKKDNGEYIRTGYCCRCGVCCRQIMVTMMNGDICKYAFKEK